MNEKLQKLYDLYKQQGIITDATSFETFANATPEQQQSLWELGAENGLFVETVPDDFKAVFEESKPKEPGFFEGLFGSDKKSANTVSNTMMGKVGAYEPDVKKKAASTASSSGKSLSALPSKPKDEFQLAAAKMRGEFIPPTGTLEEQAKSVEGQESYMGMTVPKEKTYAGKQEKERQVQSKLSELTSQQDYKESVGQINQDLISNDEENVVPRLNYLFKDYGFNFDEAGAGYDAITVTAPNGKTLDISIDRFSDKGDIESSNELKAFMEANKPKIENATTPYDKYYKRYKTQKEVDSSLKSINDETNNLLNEEKYLAFQEGKLSDEKVLIDKMPDGPERQQRVNDLIAKLNELDSRKENFVENKKLNTRNKAKLDESIGQYTRAREQEGGIEKAAWNTMVSGVGKIAYGVSDMLAWVGNHMQEGMTYEEATQAYEDVKKERISKIPEVLQESVGFTSVSKEYEAAAQKDFLKRNVLGIAGFLPMLGAMTVAPEVAVPMFFASGYGGAMEEMDKSEAFKDVSSGEKVAVASVLGTIEAVLMTNGVTNRVLNTAYGKQLIESTIKRMGSETSAKTIQEFVENEVKSGLAKGLITTASSAAHGAALGVELKVGEDAAKYTYNKLKEEDKFQMPETFGGWLKEVGESGLDMAVGGAMMSSIKSIGTAYKDNKYDGVSDATLENYKDLTNPVMLQAYEQSLDIKVANGEITRSQKNAQMNDVRMGISVLQTIPDNYSPAQKRKAVALIKERTQLEQRIEGKDKSLVKGETERITEINKELEDVSKQAPAEAPAAPEAQPAIPEEIASLKDDEPVIIKVATLEEIPEEFRDRAEKSKIKGTITTREKILGLPIGKKTTKTVDFGYTYTLTGKEAKDYAIQKSKSEESVLRTEQPEVELPTMGEGNAQETTAQEGVTPAKPEEVKPTEEKPHEQQLAELEQMFPETKTGENKGVAASDTKAMEEIASRATDERVQKVVRTAQKLTKTLKSLFPTADIHLHETEESYNGAMEENNGEKGSSGNIKLGVDADGKPTVRIDIDATKASALDVAHEVAHAVLQKAFGSNEKLFKSFQDKIAKVISTDKNQRLLDFANNPKYREQGVTYEEYMAELKAILSEEGAKIELSTAKKIAAVINEFVSKITNGKFKPFQEITDVKQVVDFVNKVTEAMAKGEAIDVEAAGKIGEGSRSSIRVLHGSPHEFNKFSTEKIGTGEGAQAFGWGLYFTDLKGIAEAYAKKLTPKGLQIIDIEKYNYLQDMFPNLEFAQSPKDIINTIDTAISMSEMERGNFEDIDISNYDIMKSSKVESFENDLEKNKRLDYFLNRLSQSKSPFKKELYETTKNLLNSNKSDAEKTKEFNNVVDKYADTVNSIVKQAINDPYSIVNKKTRNVYDVTLHEGKTPDQYTYLEWDKPVNKERANKLISKLTEAQREQAFGYGLSGIDIEGEFYKKLTNAFGGKYNGGDKAASLFLLENGVDGIKYPAESIARGATSENARGFNYVVFDENAATINAVSRSSLRTAEQVDKMVKDARASGYSERAIEEFLQKRGVDQSFIDKSLGKKEAGKKIVTNEEMMPGYDKMMEDVNSEILRGLDRKTRETTIKKNVMKIVEGSEAYKNATDQQREQMVRDVKEAFGEKIKPAPSAKKILGLTENIKKITMDLSKYHKERYEDMEKAEANKAKAIKKASKEVTDSLKGLVRKGQITTKQMVAVLRKLNKTNVLSKSSVKEFTDYMSKVFTDAEYANKLSEARKLSKAVSKASKNKGGKYDANIVKLATEFKKIDPAMVEDLDQYNKMASELKSAIKGSTLTKEGPKFAETIKIADFNEYVEKTIEAQKEKYMESLRQQVQDSLGKDASGMTYKEMIKLLAENTPDKEITKEQKEAIINATKDMFAAHAETIKKMLETGKDPSTGEDIDIKGSKKDVVERFMKMDTTKMDIKDAIAAVDALNNFIANQSTAKMDDVVSKYEGRDNSKIVKDKNIKSKPLRLYFSKGIGRGMTQQFVNLPIVFERLFKSPVVGAYVQKMMGVTDLINNKSRAAAISKKAVNDYFEKFYKADRKANGEKFNSSFNDIERGVLADMLRTIVGTPEQVQAEFERKKGLLEQSIEKLKKGDDTQKKKADIYQKVYDKIVKDSNSPDEVKAKADATNVEAVDYWIKEWSNHYDDLADVSENVYNRILDKDLNYTPVRFSKIEEDNSLESEESAFHSNNGTIFKKKTGSLMEATRPDELPENRYVDYSFDSKMSNSLHDALVDIYTAADIRKVEAFIKSDSFKDIFPNVEDRRMLEGRIQLMVRNFRNKNHYDYDELSKSMKYVNKLGNVGVAAALGGFFQPIKQTIPVAVNTLVNAGDLSFRRFYDKENIDNFLDNSGYGIAVRGKESTSDVKAIDTMIEDVATNAASKGAEWTTNKLKKLQEYYLKKALVEPDVAIARMSWITYYEKSLKEQGIDTKNIDYSDHKINKEAADYAQKMVDRQQNISDSDLKGKFFSNKDATSQLFSKVLFPFASFRMNQSARLASDFITLTSKTTSLEDKKKAAKSLGAASLEIATFNAIGGFAASLLYSGVKSLMANDNEDEEDKKKREEADQKYISLLKKGRATSAIQDFLSPMPATDWFLQYGLYKTIDALNGEEKKGKEDEQFNILKPKAREGFQSLGVLGIMGTRASDLIDITKMATTGTFEDDYGNTKNIRSKDKGVFKTLVPLAMLNSAGALPAEFYTAQNIILKDIKKQASTKTEAEIIQDKAKKREQRADNIQKIQIINQAINEATDQDVVNELMKMKRETRMKLFPDKISDEAKEVLKKKRERERASYKHLLGGYDTKEDLKRYDPDLYEQNFGENSDYAQTHQAEVKADKLYDKIKKQYKDELYDYTPPAKKKSHKRKKNSDGSYKKSYFRYSSN